jgi:hypothetical protein
MFVCILCIKVLIICFLNTLSSSACKWVTQSRQIHNATWTGITSWWVGHVIHATIFNRPLYGDKRSWLDTTWVSSKVSSLCFLIYFRSLCTARGLRLPRNSCITDAYALYGNKVMPAFIFLFVASPSAVCGLGNLYYIISCMWAYDMKNRVHTHMSIFTTVDKGPNKKKTSWA